MESSMTKFLYKLTTLAAVACVSLTAVNVAQAATATATAQTRHWATESTPAHDAVTLTAVSCLTRYYCVALGTFEFGSNGQEKPAAYEWNGSTWTVMSVPSNASELTGIACASIGYCIVVGGNRSAYAEAWILKGASWISQSTHNESQGILWGVRCAGPTSCEAVGEHAGRAGYYPLAEYWNGRTWSKQSTWGAPIGSLSDVACRSVGSCEAVGTDQATGNVLAMRLRGSKWVTETTPALPAGAAGYGLSSVSCFSNGCTAVGTSGAGTTVAEAWAAGKWALKSPVGSGDPAGTDSAWNGVHCSTVSNCVAVGGSANAEGGGFRTLVETWNGATWRLDKTPSPSGVGDQLFAVSCTSLVCTAVGSQDVRNINRSNSLAVQSCPETVTCRPAFSHEMRWTKRS